MIYLFSKNNSWSRKLFQQLLKEYPEWVSWISHNHQDAPLSISYDIDDWLLFFHWSHKIPNEIIYKYKCIAIHTSNLPDGKGGHPIQNQISDGVLYSRVNAIQPVEKIDSGPIYGSIPISLQGSLADIMFTIADASYFLAKQIISFKLQPSAQLTDGTVYKRRQSNELDMLQQKNLLNIYDFIRMLDGEGYENAYICIGDYKLSFSRASLVGEEILADVRVTKQS